MLRPLHQDDGRGRKIIKAKLLQFARITHAVEIGMHKRKARQFVCLHQRERRAWDFQRNIVGKVPDERPRECRFAGAEVAGQTHDVARLERRGKIEHKLMQRLLTRHCQREA
jgi:hypothetical protein